MKGKKKGRVEKHRGNPHGNGPHLKSSGGKNVSDDNLRQEANDPGISQAPKDKQ